MFELSTERETERQSIAIRKCRCVPMECRGEKKKRKVNNQNKLRKTTTTRRKQTNRKQEKKRTNFFNSSFSVENEQEESERKEIVEFFFFVVGKFIVSMCFLFACMSRLQSVSLIESSSRNGITRSRLCAASFFYCFVSKLPPNDSRETKWK